MGVNNAGGSPERALLHSSGSRKWRVRDELSSKLLSAFSETLTPRSRIITVSWDGERHQAVGLLPPSSLFGGLRGLGKAVLTLESKTLGF